MNTGIREMWETSMKGLKSLIRRTTPSSFAYICEKTGSSLYDKVVCSLSDYIVCQIHCEKKLKGCVAFVYADG